MFWLGWADSPFILVMLLSEPQCRRVMTTLVRTSAVRLSQSDGNVRKDRSISFTAVLFVSVLSPCHSSKITVISPLLEEKMWVGFCHHYLNLNPHLYIGKVCSLTSVPAASPFPTFSLRKCPSSLLSVSAGSGDHVCTLCGTFTEQRR